MFQFKTIQQYITIGLILRLILLLYGEYMDKVSIVKYTDIDYIVFSDAAKLVYEQQSPYLRSTYRYTPLLAWLMIPNIWFSAFGKLVFIMADLVVGYLSYKILLYRKVQRDKLLNSIGYFWLLNPFVANISSRGNAESLLICIILTSFYFILKNQLKLGACLFGLAVHWKIYPVIYALPIWFFLDRHYPKYRSYLIRLGKRPVVNPNDKKRNLLNIQLFNIPGWNLLLVFTKNYFQHIYQLFNRIRLEFFIYSFSTFLFLNLTCYYLYDMEFLYQTYFYHLIRKDHRHNFSFWFLPIYLGSNTISNVDSTFITLLSDKVIALFSFLPQFGMIILVGFYYSKDFFLATFLQTWIFVIFNKVCTSQYFMWYIGLLPLILPFTKIKFYYKGILLLFLWILSQILWLIPAYYLEFEGYNTFMLLFLTSILMLFINVFILSQFIKYHNYQAIFNEGKIKDINLKLK